MSEASVRLESQAKVGLDINDGEDQCPAHRPDLISQSHARRLTIRCDASAALGRGKGSTQMALALARCSPKGGGSSRPSDPSYASRCWGDPLWAIVGCPGGKWIDREADKLQVQAESHEAFFFSLAMSLGGGFDRLGSGTGCGSGGLAIGNLLGGCHATHRDASGLR